MTQQQTGAAQRTSSPGSPQQLRAEVERAREQLAGTVEELVGKADVRALAREKASAAGARIRGSAQQAAQQAAQQGRGRAKAASAAGAALIPAAVLVFIRWRRHGGRR